MCAYIVIDLYTKSHDVSWSEYLGDSLSRARTLASAAQGRAARTRRTPGCRGTNLAPNEAIAARAPQRHVRSPKYRVYMQNLDLKW